MVSLQVSDAWHSRQSFQSQFQTIFFFLFSMSHLSLHSNAIKIRLNWVFKLSSKDLFNIVLKLDDALFWWCMAVYFRWFSCYFPELWRTFLCSRFRQTTLTHRTHNLNRTARSIKWPAGSGTISSLPNCTLFCLISTCALLKTGICSHSDAIINIWHDTFIMVQLSLFNSTYYQNSYHFSTWEYNHCANCS